MLARCNFSFVAASKPVCGTYWYQDKAQEIRGNHDQAKNYRDWRDRENR